MIQSRSINNDPNLLIKELRSNATNMISAFSKLTPELESVSKVRASNPEVHLSTANKESGASPMQLFFLQY